MAIAKMEPPNLTQACKHRRVKQFNPCTHHDRTHTTRHSRLNSALLYYSLLD